jgi:hypothetical protein
MQTAGRTSRRWKRALWIVGLVFWTGCSFDQVLTVPPPQVIPVGVNYLPNLVKGARPAFPPAQVLILLPVDKREAYPVKYGEALPAAQDNAAVLGIWGLNSKEGAVLVNSSRLGAQRRMKAGVKEDPDMPRGIFTLTDLDHLVQDALESHFQEAGFPVRKVDFSSLQEPGAATEPAHYALGCVIEEFSLISLLRYNEVEIFSPLHPHAIEVPIRGPTRADVAFTLVLYRWPSGAVLWEGKVADSVDDPPLGESEFLYHTPGEVLSMALSRAVGSILVSQSLQDVLMTR